MKRPAGGTSVSPLRGDRSPSGGTPGLGYAGIVAPLMSSTATVSRFFAARPGTRVLRDAAIVAVALAGSLTQLLHGGIVPARPGAADLDRVAVILAVCSALPLLAWRRSPLGVFVVTAGASVALAGLGYAADLVLGPIAALYLLASSRDKASPWTRHTTATAVGLLAAYLTAAGIAQGTFPGIELLHTGLGWAGVWFAGERTRLRREQMTELKMRALRAERDAERERRLAVAEERSRIARDLHDSAGHAITLIAVRAGAARLRRDQDPDRYLTALESVEDLARQTVEEMDQIVATLRDDDARHEIVEVPPGLASLDTLIASHAAAGLAVTLKREDQPRTLDGATDQAAYRILQEALTNAARHGAGSATIAIQFDDTAVELIITNRAPSGEDATGGDATRPGGGHGLIGMRERAALLGGDLDAQRSNGTFRVHARIPYGGRRA